jgi:hypothetical protein
VFRSITLVLIPLTMAWKLVVAPENFQEVQSELVDLLSHAGFRVTAEEQTVDGMQLLRARSQDCSMQVAKISAVGSNRDMIRGLAGPNDRITVLFRGRFYNEQPTTLTAISFLWSKALRELGLIRHIVPVFAIVSSPGCDLDSLPWHRLADL